MSDPSDFNDNEIIFRVLSNFHSVSEEWNIKRRLGIDDAPGWFDPPSLRAKELIPELIERGYLREIHSIDGKAILKTTDEGLKHRDALFPQYLDRFYPHLKGFFLTAEQRALAEALLKEADSPEGQFDIDRFALKVLDFVSQFGPMPRQIVPDTVRALPSRLPFSINAIRPLRPPPEGWSKSELVECLKSIFKESPEGNTRSPLAHGSVERLLEKEWLRSDETKGLWLGSKGQEELKEITRLAPKPPGAWLNQDKKLLIDSAIQSRSSSIGKEERAEIDRLAIERPGSFRCNEIVDLLPKNLGQFGNVIIEAFLEYLPSDVPNTQPEVDFLHTKIIERMHLIVQSLAANCLREVIGIWKADGPYDASSVASLQETIDRHARMALLGIPKKTKVAVAQLFDKRSRLDSGRVETIEATRPVDSTHSLYIQGVTLRRAAMMLNDDNDEAVKVTIKQWRNKKRFALPSAIGKSIGDSQVDLFEPSALADFLLKNGIIPDADKSKFIKGLHERCVKGEKI